MTYAWDINGRPGGAWSGVGWTFRTGIEPVLRTFEMERNHALALQREAAGGTPMTLTIRVPGRDDLVVSQLQLIALAQTSIPETLGVTLADVRWRWRRRWVSRRFNMRTKSGVRRRGGDKSIDPDQIQPVIDDLDFKDYSLAPSGAPWQPREALEAVLEDIGQAFRVVGAPFTQGVPLIEVALEANGASALGELMARVPGLDVWIDEEGMAVFENTLNGTEGQVLEALGPPIYDEAIAVRQTYAAIAPSAVECLWTNEVELRFDGDDSTSSATVTDDEGEDPLALDNVVQVPDAELTISLNGGRVVVAGAYVTTLEFVDGVALDPRPAQDFFRLDLEAVRLYYLNPAAWQRLMTLGGSVPDPVLSARMEALRAGFRLMWRIKRRTRMLLHDISTVRAAVMDVETGNRGAGNVYCDWAVQYSVIGRTSNGRDVKFFDNFDGAVAPDGRLRDGRVAPVLLAIEDKDLGVLRMTFASDLYGTEDMVIPGNLRGVRTNSSDLTKLPRPDPRLEVDGQASARIELATLGEGFTVSMILTVIPGVPNDAGRLHKVTMFPNDVRALLPREIGEPSGPVVQVRVLPTIDTARWAWDDEKRAEFVAALREDPPRFPPEPGRLVNSEVVTEFSRALAASVFATYLPRHEGQQTGGWNPALRPSGNARTVAHEVTPDAGDGSGYAAVTIVDCPAELAAIDPLAIMHPAARAMLLREVIRED